MRYTELFMRDQDTIIRGDDPYGMTRQVQRVIVVSQTPYEVDIRSSNAIVRKQAFIELNRFDFAGDKPGNLIRVNYRLIEHMEARDRSEGR